MTQVDYGNKECIPKKAECKEKPPVVSNICTDKGKVSHCNDGFKRKFKQLWDRAFSSLISVNGKTQEAGTGNVTLTADDIPNAQHQLTAGDNITIEGNVISAAGGSEAVWGNITGDLNDQTDLKNELTGIIDRVDDNAEAIEALDTAKADVGDSYTKAEEDAKLGTKQNELTAGDNIVISGPQNNIISATVPAPAWGNITGELVDQTDLKNRLDGIDSDVADLEQAVQDLDTEKADTSYVDSEVEDLTDFINSVSAGVTALDNNTYKKTYIDNQLATKQGTLTAGAGIGISANNTISCTVPGFSVQVVSVLPATGVIGVIYLVPLLGPTSQNIYNEFIWVNGQWEQIGTTQIDLSDYKVWNDTKDYIDTGDEGLQEYIDDVHSAQTVIGTQLQSHKTDTSNPHSVTKAQVGLGNVDNTSDANKPVSTATQTALNTMDTTLRGLITAERNRIVSHTERTNNPHSVTKAQVGLGNVDNTSDADKPISTATQTALDGKASTTQLISGLNGKANNFGDPSFDWAWGVLRDGSGITIYGALKYVKQPLPSGHSLVTVDMSCYCTAGNSGTTQLIVLSQIPSILGLTGNILATGEGNWQEFGTSGQMDVSLVSYGSRTQTSGNFIGLGRYYNTSGSFGAWTTNVFANKRIEITNYRILMDR